MKRSRIAGRSQQLWCRAGHVVAFIALVLNGCGPGDSGGHDNTMSLGLTSESAVCADGLDMVCTQSGAVQGVLEASHRAFLGIPYAAPPVGDLRWAPPVSHEGWTDVLDASAFGASCPQPPNSLYELPGVQSEDCLTLNVWTPNPVGSTSLPVMVYFHGGSFVTGSSAVPHYNGARISELGNVVVVSVNYRLGALGFLAHNDLGPDSGNYGLMDQQAALAWVKDNIAAFGGDPNNVTIFGQSSGSTAVCLHLAAPGSAGMFHRAIMQSSSCTSYSWAHESAAAQGDLFAQALGCNDAADVPACMRSKTADEVLGALPWEPDVLMNSGASWKPNIDGTTIPQQPGERFTAGTFNKVPVLLGANQDEGTIFVIGQELQDITKLVYWQVLVGLLGVNGLAALVYYPAIAYDSPGAALADAVGDAGFVCPMRETARAIVDAGEDTYMYSFQRVPDFSPTDFYGSFHGADVPFVFGTASPYGPLSAEEIQLSDKMIGYWTRFAKSGNPNAWGSVFWPRYNKLTDTSLRLDLSIGVEIWSKLAKCNFWSTVPLSL